jgi:hypothetical protein
MNVSLLDVPPILAQMNGNSIRPTRKGQNCGGNRIRLPAPTRLAKGGHVINIDA